MIRLPLLVLVASAACSAELVVRDVRVSAGGRPLGFDFTVTAPALSASGSDAFDAGLGLEAGGRWSIARSGDAVGLVVGLDGIIDAYSYGGGGDGLAATWARLSAGPGWAVSDRVTTTAEVGIQYGLSTLSLPATSSSPAFSADGTALGYDLRVGATCLLTRRFGVGVHGGWVMASHTLSGDADVTVDQSGWFAGVEMVWRFSDAPTPLE